MVKTPRTRHSKATREPVTIDLSPDEVSRLEKEQKAEEAAAAPAEPVVTADPSPAESVIEEKAEPTVQSAEPEPESLSTESSGAPREEDAAEPAPSTFGRAPEPVAEPRRSSGGQLLAGAAGGVIALAIAGGLHFAGLLPGSRSVLEDHTPAIASLEEQLASLRQQIAAAPSGNGDEDLSARLQEAEQRLASMAEEMGALRDELANAPQAGTAEPVDLSPVEERIASLENTIAELQANPAADEAALGQITADVSSLRDLITEAQTAQAQLSGRLEGLENRMSELTVRLDEQAEAPSTAMLIAVSALKATVDRGSSFKAELDTLAALAPDAPELAGLQLYAQNGVATLATLTAEADAAANAMIAADHPVDPQAGIADRLWSSAMGLVQVRPVGMVEGDGVPEIAARIDAAVKAGDFERALMEYDSLPDAAKEAGRPFIEKVRARQEVDRLVEQALAAALRS